METAAYCPPTDRSELSPLMNILVVTHYFPLEFGAPQTRLSEMARTSAETDDVTVLTGMPNHPSLVIPPDDQGKRRLEERNDGYRVIRTGRRLLSILRYGPSVRFPSE